MKPGGYIALFRSVFDNAKLDDEASRREAWIWLCAKAAWAQTIQHVERGAVNVGRGQIAVTHRSLMKQWRWPLGRVQRFIKMLCRERMIMLELVDSKTDTARSARCMLLTICNYNRFNITDAGKQSDPISRPIPQKQETLGYVFPLRREESNNLESHLESQSAKKRRKRFRSGSKAYNGNAIFLLVGHPSHQELLNDVTSVLGYCPEPENGGHWFWRDGEANRPSNVIQFKPPRTQSTAG